MISNNVQCLRGVDVEYLVDAMGEPIAKFVDGMIAQPTSLAVAPVAYSNEVTKPTTQLRMVAMGGDGGDGRKPYRLYCLTCEHTWDSVYLNINCPDCKGKYVELLEIH